MKLLNDRFRPKADLALGMSGWRTYWIAMALAWALPLIWGILWIADGRLPNARLGNLLLAWLVPTIVATMAGGMIMFVGVIALLFSKNERNVRQTRRDT